jgi:tRNA/tmRNA/rRNA uracil-C5-methylase (TrmA/RlmC/RlmD family)
VNWPVGAATAGTGQPGAPAPAADTRQSAAPAPAADTRQSAAPAAIDDLVGARFDVEVGPVAHGGHCVGRIPDGRVVFVRHTLPGELVTVEITEERKGYLRADAVEILRSSPDRVTPPCPYAGPDRCGGCDFQHAQPAAQRALKTAVVREQLIRIGRLSEAEVDTLGFTVERLPGGAADDGLGWRTRLRYTVAADDRAGLLKHRSHEVVAVDTCLIATPAVQAAAVTDRRWPGQDAVEVVASSAGDVSVTALDVDGIVRTVSGPIEVTEVAAGHRFRLDPAAFWQVHPAAPDRFVTAVLSMLAPRPGERAWDLYGGAGLFAAALADAVGPRGSVTLVESDDRSVLAASSSLAELPQVTVVSSTVERMRLRGRPDIVVLDPPRTGAGRAVVRHLIDAAPRAIAYVACDPAAFARDVATFRTAGWRLTRLEAYDAFPMTHHVECIGRLEPPGGPPLEGDV